MYNWQVFLAIMAAVFIFLFAIRKFSRQMQWLAGDRFKKILNTVTATPWRGVAAGTVFTGIIQSSTATTVLLVSLVDAGLISFAASLGVVFGANLGTTITSQLVALKIFNLAPYFVIAGFLLEHLGGEHYKRYGRPTFYFGLIFFSLSVITMLLSPLSADPSFLGWLAKIDGPLTAILVGAVFTAILQSSSVTTGLTVLLVTQGLLDFHQALGILLGANIGTTSTALIASLVMKKSAKRVAMAHAVFNILGVIIILPFLRPFSEFIINLSGSPAQQVANAHIAFNLLSVVVFIIFLKPFTKLITRIVK